MMKFKQIEELLGNLSPPPPPHTFSFGESVETFGISIVDVQRMQGRVITSINVFICIGNADE